MKIFILLIILLSIISCSTDSQNEDDVNYLSSYSNNEDGNTDEMKWDMHYLVADLARIMTLNPGDMIFSGTPANSRPVKPGDKVEVEVEGLGKLENNVVEGDFGVDINFGAQPSESEEVISTALGGDWEFRGIRSPQ